MFSRLPRSLRTRDLVATLAALAVAGLCVRLGFWQLDRLGERRARNAEVRAARGRPALAVEGAGLTADSARHRPLVARGVYDYARERVWQGRTLDGMPGVHLITPLRLADGAAVLVDRGWVPSPDASTVDARAYREPDSAVVEGLGAAAPRGRGDADPGLLGDALPYRLLPFVLQALPGGRPGAQLPVRPPPPALTDGPHLSYAIQWFSFAAILLVGTLALLRSQARAAQGEAGRVGGAAGAGQHGAARGSTGSWGA